MQNYGNGDSQTNSPSNQSASNQIDHPRLVPYSDSDDQIDVAEHEQQFGSGPSSKKPRMVVPSEAEENVDDDQIIDPSSNEWVLNLIGRNIARLKNSHRLFTGKHFTLHSVRASRLANFGLTDIVSKFTMSPMIEEPLDELLDAIDEQITLAISESEKLNGRKVDGHFPP